MPIKFDPKYQLTTKISQLLVRIEAAKRKIEHLPVTPKVLASLRETARLFTTHYSTMIEGNRLEPEQVEEVLKHEGHFPGRERDEHEVKGYYAALKQVEEWSKEKHKITEKTIQTLHALVMANGSSRIKPTRYRDGQNVIKDSRTGQIVYMPPEAKDVPFLMKQFIRWIQSSKELLCPVVAAISHYQFATVHPYYDGNGRTARLLTTLILYINGYDLKGIYSLEEYYARDLNSYYNEISIGPSHNYYMGRETSDITSWIEYFLEGMANSFENVLTSMQVAAKDGQKDREALLRSLDPKKRKALELFQSYDIVTSHQLGALFDFQPRTSAKLCKDWLEAGFLEIVDSARKTRSYKLNPKYLSLMK